MDGWKIETCPTEHVDCGLTYGCGHCSPVSATKPIGTVEMMQPAMGMKLYGSVEARVISMP